MLIRQEQNTDYEKVYNVVKTAFALAEHSDGNEQDLVVALRKGSAFIPELSLVAEENGKIVGHIMFTEVKVNNKKEIALAPLSILPEYQRKGIGQALIKEGHKIAQQLSYEFSIVLGSGRYYTRIGYVPAEQYGIKAPFDVASENYMVYDLQGNSNKLNGTVEYAKEFFEI